jgi:hypothetical protein
MESHAGSAALPALFFREGVAVVNAHHASLAAVRLLREVVDYERRLRRLNTQESVDGRQAYLVEAYRRALELRRTLIGDLPRPLERAPDPWRDRAVQGPGPT